MSHHPWGQTVKILGIQSPRNGCSCEEHPICGCVLQEDSIVCFRKVQVLIDGKEESAIAAFWVSDGVDRCRVGYLPKFHVTHWKSLEGALAQITEIYTEDSESPTKQQKHYRNSGCAIGALISPPLLVCPPSMPTKNANNMKHAKNFLNKNQKRRTSKIRKKYNICIKI